MFLAAADAVRPLLDHPAVARRWDEESALSRMSVGDLVAHASRAVTLVPIYLDTQGEPPYRDAPGYFVNIAPELDTDLDSELATAVRERAADSSRSGLTEIARAWDAARLEAEQRLGDDDPTRGITVLGGTIQVGEYLMTRVLELVIHGDDLATSLDLAAPEQRPDVYRAVIGCLVEIAARRTSPLEVIRAMSRVERSDPSILRVL